MIQRTLKARFEKHCGGFRIVYKFRFGRNAAGSRAKLLLEPVPATEIQRIAVDAGISHKTLRRAAESLKVTKTKTKTGMNAGWLWSLSPKMPMQIVWAYSVKLGTFRSRKCKMPKSHSETCGDIPDVKKVYTWHKENLQRGDPLLRREGPFRWTNESMIILLFKRQNRLRMKKGRQS